MQELDLDFYKIKKSNDGDLALFIPSVNQIEYLKDATEISYKLDFKSSALQVIYFSEHGDRKLNISDVSRKALSGLKKVKNLVVVEIMEGNTFSYAAKFKK